MRHSQSCCWTFSLFLSLLLCVPNAWPSQLSREQRQETFELVWLRVKEKHYDPTLNGVDWDAVKEKYAPLVTSAKTEAEFYQVISQMLGELKESHFELIPPSLYVGDETTHEDSGVGGGGRSHGGIIGVQIRVVEGEPVVTRVLPDSPAAKAGLHPGYVITHVGSESVNEIRKRAGRRADRPASVQYHIARMIQRQIDGPIDSTVLVRYLDDRDRSNRVTLKRIKPSGEPVKFGELPTILSEVESMRLVKGIGYLRFNIFLLPLLGKIQEAIRSFHDAPGMILDLRGNPGGIGAMAMSVSRWFYSERANLGTMKMRQGEVRFVVFPIQEHPPYRNPVVILTDEGTASTSEVMTGGMQENGRALVVGQPTAGAVLPSVIERLPIGARLQYAIADFKTPNGVLLEGRGVQPDVPVEIKRRDLLAGRDPVLDEAISVILDQHAQIRKRETAVRK